MLKALDPSHEDYIVSSTPDDKKNYCLEWWITQYVKKGLLSLYATSAILLNEAIAMIF